MNKTLKLILKVGLIAHFGLFMPGCSKKASAPHLLSQQNEFHRDTLIVSTENAAGLDKNIFDLNRIVILEEDDNTLFSDINKLIYADDMYFIADTYGARKVVSFTKNGKSYTHYGERGNGPGEFTFPTDIDIKDGIVYILDASQHKLMRFTIDGEFLSSQPIPFRSSAFIALPDKRFLFNLEPGEEHNAQLCITDNELNPIKYILQFPDNYVNTWVTPNPFWKREQFISYYVSPSDSIYTLDFEGNITNLTLLDFQGRSLSSKAKINYLEAKEQEGISHGVQLFNNPIKIDSITTILDVGDYSSNERLIITRTTTSNYVKRFGKSMSVYDPKTPVAITEDNEIISYMNREITEGCFDFSDLPDSILQAMDLGYRILLIHSIHK